MSGISTLPNDSIFYRISLDPGWNQIGDPFAFKVDLSECLVRKGGLTRSIGDTNWVENRLVDYGTGYVDVSEFEPWKGYWVRNTTSEIVDLLVPQKASGTLLSGKGEKLEKDEWRLRISAASEEIKDQDNFIGVLTDAQDGWDRFDFSEPPVIGDYLSLYFPHEDWEEHRGRYARDFKAWIRDQGSGKSQDIKKMWNFSIETNLNQKPVEVNWEFENFPKDLEIVLIDQSGDVMVDLKEQTTYKYYSTNTGGKRNFEIKVGKDLIRQNLSGRLVISQMKGYPNPSQGSAVIRMEVETEAVIKARILNLLGQTVRWIHPDEVEWKGLNPTGTAYVYEFRWNGRDVGERRVGTGIFFYEVEAVQQRERIKKIGKIVLFK